MYFMEPVLAETVAPEKNVLFYADTFINQYIMFLKIGKGRTDYLFAKNLS